MRTKEDKAHENSDKLWKVPSMPRS